jgi:hypothetical protein
VGAIDPKESVAAAYGLPDTGRSRGRARRSISTG